MSTKEIAEVKPFKVGEPLTENADGNTEPSILDSSSKACVETRRKVCIKCGNVIPQSKYKSAKYCSDVCRNAYISWRYRVNHGLIKNPGVGSGNNQERSIETLKGRTACRKAMLLLSKVCNRCSSTHNLVAHHIDHNRDNNVLSNFEILCKACHQRHHNNTRDSIGRYTKV
jgi:hypothetical protein